MPAHQRQAGRRDDHHVTVQQRRHRSPSRDGGGGREDGNANLQPPSSSRSRCSSSHRGGSRDHDQSIASLGGEARRRDLGQSLPNLVSSGAGRAPVTGILRNGNISAQQQSHRSTDGQLPQSRQLQRASSSGNEPSTHPHQRRRMPPQRKDKQDNWKNQSSLSHTESHTESETSPESEITFPDDHHYRGGPLLEPSLFDDRGRCLKHPHIRLRKKKMMGGWKIILGNCPDCCIEEMLRMRQEGNGGGNGGGFAKAALRSSGGSTTSSKQNRPPIDQLIIQSHNGDRASDDSSLISETTYSNPPEDPKGFSSADRSSGRGLHGHNSGSFSGGSSRGPIRVTRMPFTDAYGDKGWYTGEVASGSGLPDGRGVLQYCDGRIQEGRWSNGLAGGGGNGSSPGGSATKTKKTIPTSPGAPPMAPPPSHSPYGGGRGDARDPRCNTAAPSPRTDTRPPHTRPPPPPLSSSTNGAAFNNEWSNVNGKDGYHMGDTDENQDVEEEFQAFFRNVNGLNMTMHDDR